MVNWYGSVLLCITSCLIRIYAIDPSCECVVFQSYGLSKGHFHSPDYPKPYKTGINCILYSFIGDLTEIVEIKFTQMSIGPRSRHGCVDRLRIYRTLDRPLVNEHSQHDEELCGNLSNIDQRTFYSRDRALILEFHSDSHLNKGLNLKGFKGEYAFLNKGSFTTPGLIDGTLCNHHIQSGRNNTRGKFFSPRFPLKYPKSSKCQYHFSGLEKEIVSVTFKHIRLPSKHGHGCENAGDKIVVYDGINSSARELRTFCDTSNNQHLTSSGPYMYIEFTSDKHRETQGFEAEFGFNDATQTPSEPPEDGGHGDLDPKSCAGISASNCTNRIIVLVVAMLMWTSVGHTI